MSCIRFWSANFISTDFVDNRAIKWTNRRDSCAENSNRIFSHTNFLTQWPRPVRYTITTFDTLTNISNKCHLRKPIQEYSYQLNETIWNVPFISFVPHLVHVADFIFQLLVEIFIECAIIGIDWSANAVRCWYFLNCNRWGLKCWFFGRSYVLIIVSIFALIWWRNVCIFRNGFIRCCFDLFASFVSCQPTVNGCIQTQHWRPICMQLCLFVLKIQEFKLKN